jgi:hypothetical protein
MTQILPVAAPVTDGFFRTEPFRGIRIETQRRPPRRLAGHIRNWGNAGADPENMIKPASSIALARQSVTLILPTTGADTTMSILTSIAI